MSAENVTGANIRRIRKKNLGHLSDREYCDYLLRTTGLLLSKSMLSRIENGQRGVLDYELVKIAESLEIEISELFKDQNDVS